LVPTEHVSVGTFFIQWLQWQWLHDCRRIRLLEESKPSWRPSDVYRAGRIKDGELQIAVERRSGDWLPFH
jgi:hypothetical protein